MWLHCGAIVHRRPIIYWMALFKILRFLWVIHWLIVRHGMVELRIPINWLSEFALWGHVWRLVVHVWVHILMIYFEWHLFWHHLILLSIFCLPFLRNLNHFLHFLELWYYYFLAPQILESFSLFWLQVTFFLQKFQLCDFLNEFDICRLFHFLIFLIVHLNCAWLPVNCIFLFQLIILQYVGKSNFGKVTLNWSMITLVLMAIIDDELFLFERLRLLLRHSWGAFEVVKELCGDLFVVGFDHINSNTANLFFNSQFYKLKSFNCFHQSICELSIEIRKDSMKIFSYWCKYRLFIRPFLLGE